MSITGALQNALTGLAAAGRGAEVVSSNVANAMTEGYGRRALELSAQVIGGNGAGVQMVGISRHADAQLIGERRAADAEVAFNTTRSDFFERVERVIGVPGDLGALSDQVAQLEARLIEAASSPESDTRLRAVLDAATGLADHLNAAADEVQAMRAEADQSIGRQVDELNAGLQKVVDFNIQIQQQISTGRDPSALMDQRQVLIDTIARIVPVKEVPRPNGQLSLYTPGGAILVDSKAAQLGFSAVGVITADMTVGSGALSGLTINGQPVSTASSRSPIEGGSLAALFELRDELAPSAQAQLDAVARDLIERFEDPALDPTLAAGDPGLFTDRGGVFDPLDEPGLAGRLGTNASVDPARGGALWHLRAGLGAAGPGEVGDATLLQAMRDALTAGRVPASGGFGPMSRSVAILAADLISRVEQGLTETQSNVTYATTRADTLRDLELAEGVDTDHEMQTLLLVEQMYSANARVIMTVDALINQLLEI